MTITLGSDTTHPTPTRPGGPPPPDPPTKPQAIVERGQWALYNGIPMRVDGHLLRNTACRYCGFVHVDYVLGSPGRGLQLGRVPGCEVSPS